MEVVQCDRCKSIVSRLDISKFSYRSNESIRDTIHGTAVELDICNVCMLEMSAWVNPLGIAVGLREDDDE